MSTSLNHQRLLWCAATDRTFKRKRLDGETLLVGKCIHCNKVLVLDLRGQPRSHASLEHIIPRNHGGTNTLQNLAVACSRCNAQKGARLDARPWHHPQLQAVITRLSERRQKRMRPPLSGIYLNPDVLDEPPPDMADETR